MPPQNYTDCRVLGHAWYQIPDDARWSSRRVWQHRAVFKCDRCPTVRYDCLDWRGEVGQRHYLYPEDYQYDSAEERPSRADLRLAMIGAKRPRRRPRPTEPVKKTTRRKTTAREAT